MKITNSELFNLYETLIKLKMEVDTILPIRVGYNILRNIQILKPFYDSIATMRDNIAYRYGQPQPDGTVIIPPENIDKANEELYMLSNIVNEVELLTISLEDIENYGLSLNDLNNIDNIIDNGKD